jgi:hypothetical protein
VGLAAGGGVRPVLGHHVDAPVADDGGDGPAAGVGVGPGIDAAGVAGVVGEHLVGGFDHRVRFLGLKRLPLLVEMPLLQLGCDDPAGVTAPGFASLAERPTSGRRPLHSP